MKSIWETREWWWRPLLPGQSLSCPCIQTKLLRRPLLTFKIWFSDVFRKTCLEVQAIIKSSYAHVGKKRHSQYIWCWCIASTEWLWNKVQNIIICINTHSSTYDYTSASWESLDVCSVRNEINFWEILKLAECKHKFLQLLPWDIGMKKKMCR